MIPLKPISRAGAALLVLYGIEVKLVYRESCGDHPVIIVESHRAR